jgi:hypothetical protein
MTILEIEHERLANFKVQREALGIKLKNTQKKGQPAVQYDIDACDKKIKELNEMINES